jgi:FkbM family methyltransferase
LLRILVLSFRNRYSLHLLRYLMLLKTDSHQLRRVYHFYDPNNLRRFSSISRRRILVRSTGKQGERVELDLNEHIDYRFFFFGFFDDVPRTLIGKMGKANEVFFIDVGANVGLVSMAIAAEGYKTLAIEPLSVNIDRFKKNLRLNPALDLEIIESAVGSYSLTSDHKFIEIFTPPGNSGASSSSKGWNPSFQASVVQRVRIDTLDNLCLPSLDSSKFSDLLLKIDVEGMEMEVIGGATKILEKYRPRILIEWKPGQNALNRFQELEITLRTFDYRLSPQISLNESVPIGGFDPYLNYENILLMPNELS